MTSDFAEYEFALLDTRTSSGVANVLDSMRVRLENENEALRLAHKWANGLEVPDGPYVLRITTDGVSLASIPIALKA